MKKFLINLADNICFGLLVAFVSALGIIFLLEIYYLIFEVLMDPDINLI